MYPELFEIPFIHVTVKSYGLMLVVGFLSAVYIVKRLSRSFTPNPQLVTNGALYALIAGVLGARIFYVVHYFDRFRGQLFAVFAIWQGGLELLGGMVCAVAVVILYTLYHKLPVRRYLDVLAIGMLAAMFFGRIGCLLFGCCFGKPSNLPWAVRFPYGSLAYRSQVYPDLARNRHNPYIELPAGFFGYYNNEGLWIQDLKPFGQLTDEQKHLVTKGPYRCMPVHPTQIYDSLAAAGLFLVLYSFWRTGVPGRRKAEVGKFAAKPGCTFAMLFMLYGVSRFLLEYLRDDNPFEIAGLTISQLISAGMFVAGCGMMVLFSMLRSDRLGKNTAN